MKKPIVSSKMAVSAIDAESAKEHRSHSIPEDAPDYTTIGQPDYAEIDQLDYAEIDQPSFAGICRTTVKEH